MIPILKEYSNLFEDDAIIQVDEGWDVIVKDMLVTIQLHEKVNLENYGFAPTKFNFIKTTHGWLDIEYTGGDEISHEVINFSRILSFKTCELCGKIGQLYCDAKWMHWSNKKTLCKTHAIKLYYYSLI